jgi:hypothetical protein
VNVHGCVEKDELVDCILGSSTVEVIEEDIHESCCLAGPEPVDCTLGSSAMEGIEEDTSELCLPGPESVDCIMGSSAVEVIEEDVSKSFCLADPEPMETHCSSASQNLSRKAQIRSDLEALHIEDLRRISREMNICLEGCLEKSDIVARVLGENC